MWGNLNGRTVSRHIDEIYGETVHWRCNLFDVPRGRTGMQFVRGLACLLESYSLATALESVAMKAVMIMPALLLQSPHPKSKDKEHVARLDNRLTKWRDGDIVSLLHKGQTMQDRLRNDHCSARAFQKLVSVGNVKAALRLESEQTDSGCLALDDIQPDGKSVKAHLPPFHTGTAIRIQTRLRICIDWD